MSPARTTLLGAVGTVAAVLLPVIRAQGSALCAASWTRCAGDLRADVASLRADVDEVATIVEISETELKRGVDAVNKLDSEKGTGAAEPESGHHRMVAISDFSDFGTRCRGDN